MGGATTLPPNPPPETLRVSDLCAGTGMEGCPCAPEVPRASGLFSGLFATRAQPPCFTKLKGTLSCEPVGPGGSKRARRATLAMQLATEADRPELLEGLAVSTSPLGPTLM